MGDAAVLTSITTTKTAASNSSSHARTTYYANKSQETVQHRVTDDGLGSLGPDGTVSYAGKSLNVRLVQLSSTSTGYKSDHEDAAEFEAATSGAGSTGGSSTNKGGDYGQVDVGEEVLAASTLRVTYAETFAGPASHTMSWAPPAVSIDLCPYTKDYVVPGSVRFTWMGHVFEDYEGVLVRDRTQIDVGYIAGSMDYSSGVATITDYLVNGAANAF